MKGIIGTDALAAGKMAGLQKTLGLLGCLLVLKACGNFNLPIKGILDYNLSLVPARSFDELRAAVNRAADGSVIALMDDLAAGESLVITGKALTLAAYEGSAALSRKDGFDGPLFVVENGGALTLGMAESGPLTLDGGGERGLTAGSALVRVEAGGALTLNTPAVLRNNHNADPTGLGGGLSVAGTCVIRGGTVRDNHSGYAGGGIAVETGGALVMEGGKIENNFALHGGGVAIQAGTFAMGGGTIAGNRSVNGGGVLVYTGALFEMAGGSITGNFADDEGDIFNNRVGGGVCVIGGEFVLWNGTISGNEAIGGGGVFAKEDDGHVRASFVMKNGLIGGNKAKLAGGTGGNGGGVDVYQADFTMEKGTVSGNTAEHVAGGIRISSEAVFTMLDGVIGDNHAHITAGGIYLSENAKFVMENGLIGGNTVDTTYGNGVYLWADAATVFRMSGDARVAMTDEVYLRTDWSAVTLGGGFTADPVNIARLKLDPSILTAGHTVLKEETAGLIAMYRHRFPLLNTTTLTVGDDGTLQ